MSKKMKIFLSALTTIFIGCFLAAGIILYNSDYKLLNYIGHNWDFNWDFDWNWDWDHYDYDNSSDFTESRDISFDDSLSSISVNTTSIDVFIKYNDINDINVSLQSNRNISFDKIINKCDISNNTLNISTDESLFRNFRRAKLTISIPNKYKNNISINTTSGDINTSNASINNLSTFSTSGDIELYSVNSTLSKIGTTSGNIEANNSNLGDSDVKSTSGDIELLLNDIGLNSSISTTSGDIELSIPNTIGYNANFTTVSGDFESTNSFSRNSKSSYTLSNGDKNKQINLSTVSGDCDFN